MGKCKLITVNRSMNKMCSFNNSIPFGGFLFCSLSTGTSTYSIPSHAFLPSTRHATPLNEINLFRAENPQISFKPKKNTNCFLQPGPQRWRNKKLSNPRTTVMASGLSGYWISQRRPRWIFWRERVRCLHRQPIVSRYVCSRFLICEVFSCDTNCTHLWKKYQQSGSCRLIKIQLFQTMTNFIPKRILIGFSNNEVGRIWKTSQGSQWNMTCTF